jgi:hypothetical protein
VADKDPKASAPKNAEDKELVVAETGGALTEGGFFDGAGEGMEDFGQKDFTVPFIGILQALSKPLQKGHTKYIKDAEQGMFINSATQALYDGDKGIIVVPVHFEHRYVAWKPNQGGIAHDYGSNPEIYDSITPNEKGQRLDPEGNEIVDTMQYFVLIIDPETQSMEAAVLPFSKIHAKKSKKWNNLIRAHTEMHNGKPMKPALYFYAYKITSVPESNEKGNWYGHAIADYDKLPNLGSFGSMVFNAAKELRAQVTSGEVRAAAEEPEGASTDAGDGAGAF